MGCRRDYPPKLDLEVPQTGGTFSVVTLYLIRHATAGVRNSFGGDDHLRPLDANGQIQADAIAQELGDEPLHAIHSSMATRCRQTVEPLAQALGINVEISPQLFEGNASSTAIEFVRSFTGRNAVLCSHGDLIPDVIRTLAVGGTRLEGQGCAKGSIWRLDNSTERIESGLYLGPLGSPV